MQTLRFTIQESGSTQSISKRVPNKSRFMRTSHTGGYTPCIAHCWLAVLLKDHLGTQFTPLQGSLSYDLRTGPVDSRQELKPLYVPI